MASRYLNNITINDAYTLPSADGTNGQIITTDGSGSLSFSDAAASDAIVITVKNVSGGSLSKGTVVHPSPSASPPSGNVIEVIAADKSAASTMPAIGVLNETLADDGEGECIAFGTVKGIDTSSFSASDPIYVGASGGFTATKPSGTDLIQKIGIVVKVNASNGSIKVFGANRTNDVPAPLYVDIPNGKVGIGDSTPSVSLDINATDAIQMPAGTTAQRPTAAAGMFRYNTTDGKFEGYTTEWGEIGGGGGTLEVDQQTFNGDGSTVAFTLSTTCESENNLQVYIDGVYQSKNNFSVSGTTLTFTTAPPTGTNNIEAVHITSIAGSVEVDTFTGDGSDTTFDLSTNISAENNTQIFLDGVYQSKDNYSISGATITFSTAPANGMAIEVVHFLPSGDFTIGAVDSGDDAIIRLSGTNGFTDDVKLVAGSNITVTPSGDNITIASNVSTSYSVSVISSNTTAVANTLYVLTATLTLTLTASPSAGDSIKVSNRSGVATATIARNSEKIMGAAEDLTLDKLNAGFELIYSGSAQGWILIGVEGTAT